MSVLLLAAGLAAPPAFAQDGGEAEAARPARALPGNELTGQILYQLLLAEIAGSRGHVGLSVDAYRELARTTRDPRLAKRGAELAVFARRYDVALELARLWLVTEPGSAQAQQMLTTLLAVADRREELAAHLARELAAQGPNLGSALLQLNRALARQADKAAVRRIIDQVTTPYLGIPEAHFARALAAHQAQDVIHALGEIERALMLRPDWEQAALFRSQLQSRAAALEGLSRFLSEHTQAQEARLAYARLLVADNRYEEARREFATLLAARPDDADMLYAVAVLSMQLEDPVRAETHFLRLIELGYPEINSVRLYLGQIAEDGKRWVDALKWYAEVTPGPQYVAAQLRLAHMMARQGRVEEGLQHLRELAQAYPAERMAIVIGEAQFLRELGRHDEVFATLESSLASHPDQPELLYESALAAERLGKVDVLERKLRRLIELNPSHAHAYNALGYSLADRNVRLDEAQQLVEKALSLAPNDPFILDSRGWVLFRRGDLATALETLRKAFSLRPDPEIAAHLGEVLWTMGRREDAYKTWSDAVKINPTNEVLTGTIKRFKP